MKSIIRFAVALIACTGLAWAASACNGGGASSLEDYFEEYEKLDNKAEDATADLQREFDASLTATSLNDEVRKDLRDYYTRQIEVRQDYADSIARLDPPEAARAAHDASVTSYQAVLDAFSGIVDDIGQAQTIDDLDNIFTGAELTAAIDAANKACADLQKVADDNNVNVNLECD